MTSYAPEQASGCPPGEVLGVLPTFVFAFALLHALLSPLAGFSRGFLEAAEVALIVEGAVLVPLAVFGQALAGEPRRANLVGGSAGAVITAGWLIAGSVWFALMAGLQIAARVASAGRDAPSRGMSDANDIRDIVLGRWMLQFAALVAAMLVGHAMSDFRFGFTPSARRALLAAGVAPDCIIDAVGMLVAGFVYYFFTGVHDFFRLPCMRRARDAERAAAGEERRRFFARFVAAGLERPRAPPPAAPAPPPPRQSLDRLEAALATPEAAQALLLNLASGKAAIPLGRFLLIADAALQRVRDAGDPIRGRTLELLAGAIGADARITPLEFALQVLARKRLAPAAGARPGGPPPALASLGAECGTLLALVARGSDAGAARARGRAHLALTEALAPDPAALTLQGVTEALDRMAALDPRDRARVVEACALAAAPPGDALSALLFAIGTALDSPHA
jgi:hypothetical protein